MTTVVSQLDGHLGVFGNFYLVNMLLGYKLVISLLFWI